MKIDILAFLNVIWAFTRVINKSHLINFLLARINLPNYFITSPDTFLYYIYVLDQELELPSRD